MERPRLIEPGTKYFFNETLKKYKLKNTKYNNDLVNFWPKLKSGAMIAGDDMKSSGVYRDVQTFIDDYDLRDYYNQTPINIGKDGINQSNGFRITKK